MGARGKVKQLCQIGALYRRGADDNPVGTWQKGAERRIAVKRGGAAGRAIGDGGWTGERGVDDKERKADDRECGADDRERGAYDRERGADDRKRGRTAGNVGRMGGWGGIWADGKRNGVDGERTGG